MKTQQEIMEFLLTEVNLWKHLDESARLACMLSFALGDKEGFKEGYKLGYDHGFQISQVAERGIVSVQKKIEEMESAPAPTSSDLAKHTSRPGADSYMEQICGSFKPVKP